MTLFCSGGIAVVAVVAFVVGFRLRGPIRPKPSRELPSWFEGSPGSLG